MVHTEVIRAIRIVHSGKRFIPSEVTESLTSFFPEVALTPREVEVLALVARGLGNKEVGHILGTAAGTIVVFVSSTTLTAHSPALPSGVVDVRVTNPAGTSAINQPADQFTYGAPTVTLVTPTAGPTFLLCPGASRATSPACSRRRCARNRSPWYCSTKSKRAT